MDKLSSWLWLLVALIWLLPLVGVDQLGAAGSWIVVIAVAIIGITGLKGN